MLLLGGTLQPFSYVKVRGHTVTTTTTDTIAPSCYLLRDAALAVATPVVSCPHTDITPALHTPLSLATICRCVCAVQSFLFPSLPAGRLRLFACGHVVDRFVTYMYPLFSPSLGPYLAPM